MNNEINSRQNVELITKMSNFYYNYLYTFGVLCFIVIQHRQCIICETFFRQIVSKITNTRLKKNGDQLELILHIGIKF